MVRSYGCISAVTRLVDHDSSVQSCIHFSLSVSLSHKFRTSMSSFTFQYLREIKIGFPFRNSDLISATRSRCNNSGVLVKCCALSNKNKMATLLKFIVCLKVNRAQLNNSLVLLNKTFACLKFTTFICSDLLGEIVSEATHIGYYVYTRFSLFTCINLNC